MDRKLPIGERLREERERLGYSQADFAKAAEVTRKTIFGYEGGERCPPADALGAWADEGLDVLYVVIGRREGRSSPSGLTSEQELLLEAFKDMKPAKRKKLLASLLTGGDGGLDSKRDGVNVTGSGNRTAGRDYHEE